MLRDALGLISGPLKNILDQLAGEKNETWVEILKMMSRMTPGKILSALSGISAKFFMQIPVGGSTWDQLLERFSKVSYTVGKADKVGIEVDGGIRNLVQQSKFVFDAKLEDGVVFVRGTLRELLGHTEHTETELFLNEDNLAKHGYALCKASDAPYLCFVCVGMSLDGDTRIGMNPIIDLLDYYPKVINIGIGKSRVCFSARSSSSNFPWGPDTFWIFRKKKTPAELGYSPDGLI